MSSLLYDGIELELINMRIYSRDAVYDPSGTDFLYIHHVLEVDAIYNPAATSYNQNGRVPGELPAITDVWIRQSLLVPRKQLYYYVGDNPLIISPLPGYCVDAVTGPHPIHCTVKSIVGTKTFGVNYRIETWTNECQAFVGNIPALLSIRWSQHDRIGDDRVTHRMTNGLAIFRMDILEDIPAAADDFRSFCIPPEPQGFRRELDIGVSPIGNVMTFTCHDIEQLYFLGDTNDPNNTNCYQVERFEAIETMATITGADEKQGMRIPAPALMHTLDAVIYGNPDSLRSNLLLFGMRLVMDKLGTGFGPGAGGNVRPFIANCRISHHLSMRRTDIHVDAYTPPGPVGKGGAGPMRFEYLFFDPIRILPNNGDTPRLIFDGHTRANFTGSIVVQELCRAFACKTPDVPQVLDVPVQGYKPPAEYVSPQVSVSLQDNIPAYNTSYSTETENNGIYTQYLIEARIAKIMGRRALPMTGPLSSSSTGNPPPTSPQPEPSPGNPAPPNPPPTTPGAPTTPGQTDDPFAIPTQPIQTTEVLQLHLPMSEMHVEWTAERAGNTSKIPFPVINDGNLVLMDCDIQPAEVNIAADGFTAITRVSGRYRYQLLIPFGAGDPFPYFAAPWANFMLGDYAILPGDYDPNILGFSGNSPGGGTGTGSPGGGVGGTIGFNN